MAEVAPKDRCGATCRDGTKCRDRKGKGTDHVGVGRCYKHGGKSPGAPKGNKNALTTGEYETLHVSALPEQEASLYTRLDAGARAQAEGEIRLLSIREHRILLRIEQAKAEDVDGFRTTSMTVTKGWNVKGKVDFAVVERTSLDAHIMALEDALTRVQVAKTRWVDQLRATLRENPPDSGGLDAIVDVLDRSAKEIARAREAEGRSGT